METPLEKLSFRERMKARRSGRSQNTRSSLGPSPGSTSSSRFRSRKDRERENSWDQDDESQSNDGKNSEWDEQEKSTIVF